MRYADPLAAAVGNATLLGIGYLMLRRRLLAAGTTLVTALLVVLLATAWRTVWFECVVAAWWVALAVHGWYLARRHPLRVAVRRQRLVALYLALPVVLAVALLRFDGYRVDDELARARQAGDCGQAARVIDRVWWGSRIVDAPTTVRAEATHRACRRLRDAGGKLDAALATGDRRAMALGFAGLTGVLRTLPGHERMVGTTLRHFLDRLPDADPCPAAAVTDWLRARQPNHTILDTAAPVATRTAPAALVGCGDDQVARKSWGAALSRYRQLLDQFPDSTLVAQARNGIHTATLGQQLSVVRDRLDTTYPDALPTYCSKPAKYEAAPRYGRHNTSLFFGNSEYTDKLPGSWSVSDAADATLVVCAGDTTFGSTVESCTYSNVDGTGPSVLVTFYRVAIPIRAYELRTGRLVIHRTVQIGGSSCPQYLTSTSYGSYDTGPDTSQYVSPSRAQVRAAFRRVLHP